MTVSGEIPTRLHLVDSDTVTWEVVGDIYSDPNDDTKLVRDVKANVASGAVLTHQVNGV